MQSKNNKSGRDSLNVLPAIPGVRCGDINAHMCKILNEWPVSKFHCRLMMGEPCTHVDSPNNIKSFCGHTHYSNCKTNITVRPTATTCTTTQTARERAGALTFPSSCLNGGVTRVGPGRYPQYTRADFGPEAVGSSNHKHITSPINTTHGKVKSRMVAEPQIHERNPHHAAVPRQLDDVDHRCASNV